MDEAELITRARHGDEAAWGALVNRHQAAAFRLAYLLSGDADEAEDVLQEAFIRAFKALDRFDSGRSLRPWLMRITANLAHNKRRALGRYLAAVRRLALGTSDPETAAEAESAQRGQAQTLWQAVRRLRVADQEIIYLRYFLEQSEAETALALDIAPGTVKSRLHRALERLRAVVETEFPMLREEYEG